MAKKSMPGRRRGTAGVARRCRTASFYCCCVALAAAAAAAPGAFTAGRTTPSRLTSHAFVLNSNPASASAYRRRTTRSVSSRGSSSSSRVSSWSGSGSGSSGISIISSSSSVGSAQQARGSGSLARGGTSTTALAAVGAGSGRSNSSSQDRDEGSNSEEGGVVGGVWAVQDEEEWEFEEEVQRLEERLELAVKNEDYKGAAECRDELYRCSSVCVLVCVSFVPFNVCRGACSQAGQP